MSTSPPYTKPEVERRWLVPADVAFESMAERERRIEDRYIDGTRLRLCKVVEAGRTTVYKLGKKYESDTLGRHHVVTTYLSELEFEVFAALPARIAIDPALNS